jgi:hypothetical protein
MILGMEFLKKQLLTEEHGSERCFPDPDADIFIPSMLAGLTGSAAKLASSAERVAGGLPNQSDFTPELERLLKLNRGCR